MVTFFLDVFEYKRYGKEIFKDICHEAIAEGHDIQLHIHPNRGYDEKRLKMEEYSLDEQVKIIKEGKELIREWTGEYPIAYRGGGYYSIDKNTVAALKLNDIPIDSTMFYNHSKITFSRNRITEREGIIEIPITGFYRDIYWRVGPLNLRKNRSFIKTDIDWASLDELKTFVKEAKKHNIRVMNLFMHSYSLVKWDNGFTNFQPDYADIEKFTHFLEFIKSDKEIKVITMREFYNLYKKEHRLFEGSDYVPVIRQKKPFGNLVHKAIKKVLK